jgi:hypothetical protein
MALDRIEARERAERLGCLPIAPGGARRWLSHEEAMAAIIGCSTTVTLLSYEEAIGAYLSLRGVDVPDFPRPQQR